MSDDERLLQKPFEALVRAMKKERARDRRREILGVAKKAAEPTPAPRTKEPALPQIEEEVPLTDERLFELEMSRAAPLTRDNYIPKSRGRGRVSVRDEDAEALAELADLVSGETTFDFTSSDEYVEGISVGLDRRLLKKLRRGVFAVQAHVDLHGRTRLEAREIVEEFIVESRHRSLRCVLIVHGRGRNSKDQVPVLKESLKVWLARGRFARSVLAFCSARPSDGGFGAIYVLLRK